MSHLSNPRNGVAELMSDRLGNITGADVCHAGAPTSLTLAVRPSRCTALFPEVA